MTKLEQMKEEIDAAIADGQKFNRGNQAAGTRVRKSMQKIKGLAQEVRVDVQNIKNARS